MRLVVSINGIVDIERPRQGLIDIGKTGYESVLLDMNNICKAHIDRHIEISDKVRFFEERGQIIASKISEMGMDCNSMRAPHYDTSNKKCIEKEKILSLISVTASLCKSVKCERLIVRTLSEEQEDAFRFFINLLNHTYNSSVMILLENQFKTFNGHFIRGFCSDPLETVVFIDNLNNHAEKKYGKRIVDGKELPYFAICMDVGTCNLCGQNMYDFAVTLGDRIKAVIIRDCNGNQDTAMLPFTAVNNKTFQTDWLNLIRGLREIHFDGELIMDFSDTAAAYSPMLKPQLLTLAKSVADYFKWQIEMESVLDRYPSRVLFGAGNMCRNYMKNYGEKYPPLYTCDNNKNIWGQTFEGLEIKNPECLKELPEDVAIFICNIYYREIEEQLRKMGINNPIEFFNDEYMPSFYFNRLETGERG